MRKLKSIDKVAYIRFASVYKDFDDIAKSVRSDPSNRVIILSDHGMKAVGPFGDHSDYGFWSTNTGNVMGTPKITEFFGILKKMAKQ